MKDKTCAEALIFYLYSKGVKIAEPPEKRRDLEVGKCEETQLPPSYDDLLK